MSWKDRCAAAAPRCRSGLCPKHAVVSADALQPCEAPPPTDEARGEGDGLPPGCHRRREARPKVLDAKRPHAMTGDCADPGERRRMPIENRHDAAIGRHVGEQTFDMRARMYKPALTGALRGGPAGVEAIRRRDGEEAHVPAVLGHQSDGLDCFGRDRPGTGNDDLTVRPRLAQPVGSDRPCRVGAQTSR
jgi:hypothetical protein